MSAGNASAKSANAITPTRAEDYPTWYQEVIKAADLAENSPVRGCMVIKPWGYAIWERMQQALDKKFKDTGHVNAYFPLFIPLSYLEKEAAHVEGFAKECAVVTHHRLESDGKGGLRPAGELEEPLVVRPTSETIIGEMYAKWVQSYRDLPILINQWANVVRWEMRTRLFLRTTEFLWQEGHTVHATAQEAQEETLKMLDVYSDFAEHFMAMPVIKGEKTPDERFPGAVSTYSIEAMMQDKKALQAGTSHFLGQNFAKASQIQFLDQSGNKEFAWTTSWGVSTRLIGGLIMTHSDDDGLVLPPKLAPYQIVICPILPKTGESAVLEYCQSLAKELQTQVFDGESVRVHIDLRDMRGGEKIWQHIKKGVPIRLEVGPRDMENNKVFMGLRNLAPKDKKALDRNEFVKTVGNILESIQSDIFSKAKLHMKSHTTQLSTQSEFEDFFSQEDCGFAKIYWRENPVSADLCKKFKITPRCIPLETINSPGKCAFTGQNEAQMTVFGRAY